MRVKRKFLALRRKRRKDAFDAISKAAQLVAEHEMNSPTFFLLYGGSTFFDEHETAMKKEGLC